MFPKSKKAAFAALMIALVLCAASVPAVTADSHGAGSMTQLAPGAEQWYTLVCSGDETV
jgi:hypothetical protein